MCTVLDNLDNLDNFLNISYSMLYVIFRIGSFSTIIRCRFSIEYVFKFYVFSFDCVEKCADYKKFQGGRWEELQQGSKVKKHFVVKIVLVQENKFVGLVDSIHPNLF